MNAIAKSRRRYFYRQWFKTLRGLANFGMKSLTRSELAVYLLLLSETRPDGTARAGLSDLARRGGMSVRQASRAVHSLAGRELLTVVKVGVPGKPSLYSVLPSSVLRKLNPTAAQWVEDNRPTLDADVETYRHPCLPS